MPMGPDRLEATIQQLYKEGVSDYHLPPIVLVDLEGRPVGRIVEGDSLVFCCRRGEREIQLTRAFVDQDFQEFNVKLERLTFVPFTLYHEQFAHLPIAFPPVKLNDTLGEVIARNGLKQVRIAESEKFNHVTFFFNGAENEPFPGEESIRIPTLHGVKFAEVPELSIADVTSSVIESLRSHRYHLAVVNFANGDIIGHLENLEANLHCAQAIDQHLGHLLEAAASEGYVAVITADHGVFEQMYKADGLPSHSHTRSPVPFILSSPDLSRDEITLCDGGVLANIAPTILEIMGLPKPQAMTHESLIQYRKKDGKQLFKLTPSKVLLLILDGCGVGRQDNSNPLFVAPTPVFDRLLMQEPYTELQASGEAVGLLEEKSGNSEAGHMNIAAGRIVPQDDTRIDRAIKDGSIYENEAFRLAINSAKENNGALHLLAILSKKSSHGTMDYALALMDMARQEELERVFVHLIFDGRSTDIGESPELLREFRDEMNRMGIGMVATCIGRGFALDRDGSYQEKTQVAYEALVLGKGKQVMIHNPR